MPSGLPQPVGRSADVLFGGVQQRVDALRNTSDNKRLHMEQTLPTTRAEEIAADGPYRADWENGFSVVRDLNAPEGNKIMMMMPDNMEWFADRMNKARANGYKQGQQDRWISVEEDLPEGGEDVLVLTKWGVRDIAQRDWQQGWKPDHWSKDGSRIYEVEDITHWQPLPSPPNPEQR
jgi:hypothetical protein